jgi:hypothetical protein
MKDEESNTPSPTHDYEEWLESRRKIEAPRDFADRVMNAISEDGPAADDEAHESGRFKVLKVAVLFGAALVGVSRMAAMFIWILIP